MISFSSDRRVNLAAFMGSATLRILERYVFQFLKMHKTSLLPLLDVSLKVLFTFSVSARDLYRQVLRLLFVKCPLVN